MPSSFVEQLQAQPWYQDVKSVFDKAGVPAPIWESTIAVEDPSLDPAAVNNNPQGGDSSHGLFQINLYGSLGTDPARVRAALGTPVDQATWAAQKMSAALAKLPSGSDLSAQLRAVELAGWNGSLDQDAQRQAALASVTPSGSGSADPGTAPFWFILQHGMDPNSQALWNQQHGAASSTPSGGNAGIFQPVADAINNFTSSAQNIALAAGIAAVGLALIAGGFAIWAASSPQVQEAAKTAAEAE